MGPAVHEYLGTDLILGNVAVVVEEAKISVVAVQQLATAGVISEGYKIVVVMIGDLAGAWRIGMDASVQKITMGEMETVGFVMYWMLTNLRE